MRKESVNLSGRVYGPRRKGNAVMVQVARLMALHGLNVSIVNLVSLVVTRHSDSAGGDT